MLSSIGRTAIRRIGTVSSTVRVGERTWQVQRVCLTLRSHNAPKVHFGPCSQFAHSFRRSYVAATSRPSTKKATTARKSPRKSTKKAPAKQKKKKKVATKPKTRTKKVLTEAQIAKKAEAKAKAEIKGLKATALLSGPKVLPSSAWSVMLGEQMKEKANSNAFDFIKLSSDAAARYKNLTPAEREHYNHVANQNRLANEETLKAWVESHTPDQIRAANIARQSLKRRLAKSKTTKYAPIEDSRLPKRPRNSNVLFIQERWASGDMRGIDAKVALKTLQEEWTALSSGEKKHFQDLAAAEKTRYIQDYTAIFNRVPEMGRKEAAKSK